MKLPDNPIRWAIHLSGILKHLQATHGIPQFPVKVEEIAKEYSKQVFPDEPLTLVEGLAMSDRFEGMLIPNRGQRTEWGIVYNASLKSKGRKNFTLAHELGHYLVHRHRFPQGLQCSSKDMLDWKSEEALVESEANTFAAYLLMPLDDLRKQLHQKQVTLECLQNLAPRYEVSISAIILQWFNITDKRAMIVVGRDGFIDWAWSSPALLKSGVYYKSRQVTTELPAGSLAAKRDNGFDNLTGTHHQPGVWLGDEIVKEMTILSDDYNNMSISLLVYPDYFSTDFSEENEEDSYDRFTRHSRR